jgi:hypothetical protein
VNEYVEMEKFRSQKIVKIVVKMLRFVKQRRVEMEK